MPDVNDQMKKLYMLTNTTKRAELSKALGVSGSAIQNWRNRGQIPEHIFLKAQQIAGGKYTAPLSSEPLEVDNELNIKEQFNQLFMLTRTSKKSELSVALDIPLSTISNWTHRNTIPEHVFIKAQQINMDLDREIPVDDQWRGWNLPSIEYEVETEFGSDDIELQIEELKTLTETKNNLQLSMALETSLSEIENWKCKMKIPGHIFLKAQELSKKVKTIPSGFLKLPFYEVEVSAGHGALVECEERSEYMVFSHRFVIDTLGVSPDNIFLMPVRGDSMVPTLKNHSLIIVNRIDQLIEDGIYVFRYDAQLRVKRLQFSKIGITVVSDNPAYQPWELSKAELATEDFEIIGEVIWSGQIM